MTILIKNVELIDGTGRPPVKADILIKNEIIVAIGSFPRFKANETIDGGGGYLAPGFIDIHADSDHYLTLFSYPSQKDFLIQGVTTAIGGQCGASLAPLIYGSLETLRDWSDTNEVNINWHTTAEFIEAMRNRRLGVNFGTLAGHTTIKQAIIGDNFRDLTKSELGVFNLLLTNSLGEGAFGVSINLGYGNLRKTPYTEVKNSGEKAAIFKTIYAIHLRDEKRKLVSAVNEAIDVAKETGAKVLISHLKPIIGFEKEFDEALETINKNAAKADVYFDTSTLNTSVSLIQNLLPQWTMEDDKETIMKDIDTPGLREKILRELPRSKGDDIIIVNAPKNEYLIGKSLKQFSDNRSLTVGQGLLELIKLTNFRASVYYKNIRLKSVRKAILNDRAIIASNSASFKEEEKWKKGIKPQKFYAFLNYLETIEKENLLPIETAIYKITGSPAKHLGLKNRGVIREGMIADLVIFKKAEVREVLVNGRRAVKAGEPQNVLAGTILKHEV